MTAYRRPHRAVLLLVLARGHRTWRLMVSSWLRLTKWEYWPPWLAYVPVAGWLVVLAMKHRSLVVFTAANPAILAGGVVGESKIAILRGLCRSGGSGIAHSDVIASDLPVPMRRERADEFLRRHNLPLPVVLKPNAGQRGSGVVVARTREQLHAHLDGSTVDTIIQEYVPGLEFGVFYCRRPSEVRGRIISVTEKRLPFVVGDGCRSLEQLILDDPQTIGMARLHLRRKRAHLTNVPEPGEVVPLGDLGTHCRGARFFDAHQLITSDLEFAFDELSQGFEGFYFGRYDVRVPSIEDFTRGRGIVVIELNGVTSEATHIYDPGVGLLEAYRVLFEQWRLAFEIGAENVRCGAPVTSLLELAQLALRYRNGSKGHLEEPPAGTVVPAVGRRANHA